MSARSGFRPSCLALLLLALVTGAAQPLLEERFDAGFAAAWAERSAGIEVVPEDAVQPTGNHVARFTAPGQMLAGPWVKPGDWQGAADHAAPLEQWGDYTLSFRFRVRQLPAFTPQMRGRGELLRIFWRVCPAEDNPGESYRLDLRCPRTGNWDLAGPSVHWERQDQRPGAVDEQGPAGGKADTAWHTFAVTFQGDTMTTMFDGDFHQRVRDTRIGYGAIALQAIWSPEASPGWVEIDDVRVVPVGEGATPRRSPEERLALGLTRGCLIGYYPSSDRLVVSFDFRRGVVQERAAAVRGQRLTGAQVQVLPAAGDQVLAATRVALAAGQGPETTLAVPPLRGQYRVRFTLAGPDGVSVVEKPLRRDTFAWEGNTLGITDEIYPPFTPVAAAGPRVAVVQRQYTMNGFGLWDSVVSQERELLAAPMTVRFETAAGEGQWTRHEVALRSATPAAAVYAATAESGPVRLDALATVEFDGCMKVALALAPGAQPVEVKRLWLDLPLRTAEAPLLHCYVDGIRLNHAGATPAGEGVVWHSGQARRRDAWLNSFCSYVWLGAEERGLAWFAENDRGWLTAKDGGKLPVQELRREGDRLTLRVYLINTPATLTARRELVFGLQASPVKPMPEDWRARSNELPAISGPVNPWGGLSCSYKGPYGGDWTIVDRIAEAQRTGKLDEGWLTDYVAQHNPPPVQGTWNWADSVRKFVDKWAVPRRPRPALVYAEEMAACTLQPEWWTFQDEWSVLGSFTQREELTDERFRQGPAPSSARSAFPPSYQDYALWYHQEWLRRGISLYWDNSHAIASTNVRTSAAYVSESGAVQPALILWQQRDYMKRAWNLLQYWRRHQPEPLELSIHRTNSHLLPLHGWATISLDFEWSARYAQPFPPDEIRTTAMGRQTGVFGHDHRELWGKVNPAMLALAKSHPEWPGRATWGMRMVHEMPRRTPPQAVEVEDPAASAGRALEQRVTAFGYGTDAVRVHNYWATPAALTVAGDQVKWLALAKPATGELLVVLANWSAEAVATTLTLHPDTLGFTPGAAGVDAETGEALARTADGAIAIVMPPVYGVRLLSIGAAP